MGIKGLYNETRIEDDHQLYDSSYSVLEVSGDSMNMIEVPGLNSVNERLRDGYIKDSELGLRRWNKIITDEGIDFQFSIPYRAFNRAIGQFANLETDPLGNVISSIERQKNRDHWLPNDKDRKFVKSKNQGKLPYG